jgi:hypothetical protein
MAVDPNIALGVRGLELQSPLAQYGQVAQIQNAQNQNALAQFQLGAAQRADQAAAIQNEIYAKHYNPETGGVNINALVEEAAKRGQGGIIPGILKSENERLTATANLAKVKTETEKNQFQLQKDKLEHGWQSVGASATPADAVQRLVDGVKKGYFDMATAGPEINKVQNMTPEQFKEWRINKVLSLMDAKDQFAATVPKIMSQYEAAHLPIQQQTANAATSQANTAAGRLGVERSGLSLRALQADPFNMSGAQAAFPLAPVSNGSGNAMAPTGGANAMAPRPAAAPAPAIANAPAGDTISGKQIPLGQAINQGLTGPDLLAVMPKTLAGQVSAILEHRAAPPSGNTTRSSQLMQLVQAADPTYDAQQYKTKQGIETAFTAGLPSRTLKSINVADDHLKVLNSTIDALQNGDVKLLNQLGNAIATQMGAPAPTDFNGVKTIVADELVKAILGGAGALGDRKAIQDTVSSANSPEQLRSMIKRYQQLMDGQRTGLAEQYKSGGGNNINVLNLLNRGKAAAVTGVDQQALEWANANPNDPRAAQIKQRLGAK